MRALLQRVSHSKVSWKNKGNDEEASISRGWLILLGVGIRDTEEDVAYLVNKVLTIRGFPSDSKPMDLSIKDISGELMVVSQFTLYGSCLKGRRPDFTGAANPSLAKQLYEQFVKELRQQSNLVVKTGSFGSHMHVDLLNDGPVTLLLESASD